MNVNPLFLCISSVHIGCNYYIDYACFFDYVHADNDYYIGTFLNQISIVYYLILKVCLDYGFPRDFSEVLKHRVPWDHGGSTWHRLEVKPKFKEGGMLATFPVITMDWTMATFTGPWAASAGLGFSVRVSNELGASRPKEAKFSVAVAATTSAFIGAIFMAIFFIWRRSLPRLFSDDEEVVDGASKLGYLLAVTIFFGTIGPVLSGVAVGAGWQVPVAFANIGCYYLVGIPVGVLFGFKFKVGALGIWMGMLTGTLLQMTILLFIIKRTHWEKQALLAAARIKVNRGKNEDRPFMPATCTEDDQIDTSSVEINVQTREKYTVNV